MLQASCLYDAYFFQDFVVTTEAPKFRWEFTAAAFHTRCMSVDVLQTIVSTNDHAVVMSNPNFSFETVTKCIFYKHQFVT